MFVMSLSFWEMIDPKCIYVEDLFYDDCFAQLKVMMLEIYNYVVGVKICVLKLFNMLLHILHEN